MLTVQSVHFSQHFNIKISQRHIHNTQRHARLKHSRSRQPQVNVRPEQKENTKNSCTTPQINPNFANSGHLEPCTFSPLHDVQKPLNMRLECEAYSPVFLCHMNAVMRLKYAAMENLQFLHRTVTHVFASYNYTMICCDDCTSKVITTQSTTVRMMYIF